MLCGWQHPEAHLGIAIEVHQNVNAIIQNLSDNLLSRPLRHVHKVVSLSLDLLAVG